jgi:rhamnose utilization protein RhaD (predicted bifunctional aldolase and dehydrogenase)
MADLLGQEHDVLCVKGSGWDMAVIEPPGLPAVKLGPAARAAQARQAVRRGHGQLPARQPAGFGRAEPVGRDAAARLPAAYLHRPHARGAVLSLVDQPNGEELCEEVYDGSMGFVPYVIPGFGLAKMAARCFDAKPDVEGLILHKHGIFTFGETAREAYERMIAHVTRAEQRLAKGRRNVFAAAKLPKGWPRRPRSRPSFAGPARSSRPAPMPSRSASCSTSAPARRS